MEDTPQEPGLDLAALVELARTLEGRDELAQAICALAVAELGLSGASISVVRDSSGEPRLDSIAAVGQLSSFMLDLSTPLDKLTDATRTALDGEPLFVGNPHGIPEDAEKSTGVSRWREGFSSHAYATLGLTVLEGTLGVLIFEWPEPQPFDEAERASLQLFADVVALALRGAKDELTEGNEAAGAGETTADAEAAAAETSAGRASCAEAAVAAFQMNTRGLVVSEEAARSWREVPVVRVWTAATLASSGDAAALAHVAAVPTGGIATVVAAVSGAPVGEAAAVATTGQGVVHAAAIHNSAPGEILGMLGGSLRSYSGSAWASGVAAVLFPASGAFEVAEAGSAAMLLSDRGGRVDVVLAAAPPVGTGAAPPASRMHLLLPGDRIALLSGGRTSFAIKDVNRTMKAQRALATLQDHGGPETARTLLGLVCDEGSAASVCVIEMVAVPREPIA